MINEQLKKSMEMLLKDDAADYFEALKKPPVRALRINGLKSNFETVKRYLVSLEPTPLYGYYYTEPAAGAHFLHHAGHFYIQDPAAMAVVEAFKPFLGKRILDLCAAPGGKTLQLAEYAPDSLIIANDVDYRRAKTLEDNLTRCGVSNAVVTSNIPIEFLPEFAGFFDTVLVDAPCSGEGMLRKERINWSPAIAKACYFRQKEILRAAAAMLCPGGYLMYSTCTFNPLENERVIADICKMCGLTPVQTQRAFGAEQGIMEITEAQRLYPHKTAGEGQVFCLLQKNGSLYEYLTEDEDGEQTALANNEAGPRPRPIRTAEISEVLRCLDGIADIDITRAVRFKNIFSLPPSVALPDLGTLNILSVGTNVLEEDTPAHALIMALEGAQIKKAAAFKGADKSIAAYLRGEQINTDAGFSGYGAVLADGIPLGLVRSSLSEGEKVLKNHYPKYLRNK